MDPKQETPIQWKQNALTAFTIISQTIEKNPPSFHFVLEPRYAGKVFIRMPDVPLIPITVLPLGKKAEALAIEPLVRTDSLNPMEISRENTLLFKKPSSPAEIDKAFQERSFPIAKLLLAFGFIGLLPLLIVLLRKHPIKPKETSRTGLLNTLQELEKSLNANYLKPEMYQNLNLKMRYYIQERYGINAPFLTTEEFLQEASRNENIDSKNRETLKAFLKESDRVKFKGKPLTLQDLDASLKLVHKIIKHL